MAAGGDAPSQQQQQQQQQQEEENNDDDDDERARRTRGARDRVREGKQFAGGRGDRFSRAKPWGLAPGVASTTNYTMGSEAREKTERCYILPGFLICHFLIWIFLFS